MSAFVNLKSKVGFVGGLAVFALLLLLPLGLDAQIQKTLAVLALCAIWWGTEAISIYATSLVPAILLPLLGILPLQEALSQYANRLVFLFLGGFIIARAMIVSGLDRRTAAATLAVSGTRPEAVLGAFMVVTAVLSAFISNTATATMMVAVISPLILSLKTEDRFRKALILGIAFAANLGGMATIIGTPPNQRGSLQRGVQVPNSIVPKLEETCD